MAASDAPVAPEGLGLPRLRFPHCIHDKVETKFVVMAAVDSVARRRIKHHFKLTLRFLQCMDRVESSFQDGRCRPSSHAGSDSRPLSFAAAATTDDF